MALSGIANYLTDRDQNAPTMPKVSLCLALDVMCFGNVECDIYVDCPL